jgi:hypothetical protein
LVGWCSSFNSDGSTISQAPPGGNLELFPAAPLLEPLAPLANLTVVPGAGGTAPSVYVFEVLRAGRRFDDEGGEDDDGCETC